MKIQVKKVRAWENDPSAPTVLGFFGSVNEDVKKIFKEVSTLTESQNTREHMGKFYFNNIQQFWYVRDVKAAEMAIDKINKKYGENTAKIVWNTTI